ncbi:MAG: putative toxin-antitoxin system toxin component, PIN family [bacterium]
MLDTNVLVSALLTEGGTCSTLLRAVLAGRIEVCADDRILAEYERVCHEPRLGLDSHATHTILACIREIMVFINARPLSVILPDIDDLPFLEVADTAGAFLVTGNKKHFPPERCGSVAVLSPAEFLTLLRSAAIPE